MLQRLREKSFGCHSERSEESLLDHNKALRGILRARPALRMTAFGIFPQALQPARLSPHQKSKPRRLKSTLPNRDARAGNTLAGNHFHYPAGGVHFVWSPMNMN